MLGKTLSSKAVDSRAKLSVAPVAPAVARVSAFGVL